MPAVVALTRAVPPSIEHCELTHVARGPIDVARATAQHARYEDALRSLGCTVHRLPPAPALPDAVFVEDTAVVLDEVAVVTRPGAASRRAETDTVVETLLRYRPVCTIEAPGTLEGGDVLQVGRTVYVGRSSRTNDEGIRQLGVLLSPFGYDVRGVPVNGCLHLKTAVSQVADGTLLINRDWVDAAAFAAHTLVDVHPDEPFAANAVRVDGAVLYPEAHPHTRARLTARGLSVRTVAVDELAKAEAGVTCCSLLFDADPAPG